MSSGNLSPTERWASSLAGFGLLLGASLRGSFLRRLTFLAGGATLLSRGLVGYCGMKAAFAGDEDSLGEGIGEQWQRMRSRAGAGAVAIDTLEALQLAELQELAGSTCQLARLLERIERVIGHSDFQSHVRSYATHLHTREPELERIITSHRESAGRHADQAMQTLISEARKMTYVADPAVRDAALVDSLQRILHYQIAAEGSAAAHAKALGRDGDAVLISEWSDHDKATDASLTELAETVLNPRAAGRRGASAEGSLGVIEIEAGGTAGEVPGPDLRAH